MAEIDREDKNTEWCGTDQEYSNGRDVLAERRTELADERTELAKHRTALANERTFSAWIRTGMAATGVGLTIAELLGDENGMLPKIIGIFLTTMGAAICVMALLRYINITSILGEKGISVIPKLTAFILTGGLLLAIFLVLAFILIE